MKDRLYSLGQIVYLKTDMEQLPRMITGIIIRPSSTLYYLSLGTNETVHYEMEVSKERDIIKATS